MFRKETGFNHDSEKKCLDKERYLKSYFAYEGKIDEIRLKRAQHERQFRDERSRIDLEREADVALRKREREDHENKIILENEATQRASRDNKYRQYVRENSTEIRELERKLSAAYVNKIREVQLAERDFEMARLKALKFEEAKQIEREQEIVKIEKEIESKKSYLEMMKYNSNLRSQLDRQERESEEAALLQFALDKIMIEEIVQKIMEEDRRTYEEELQKRCEFQKDIQLFLQDQEQIRAKEHEQLEEEKQKVLKYLQEQDQKAKDSAEAKKQKEKFYQEMQEKLASFLVASRKDRTEEENLRYELESEELLEKQLGRERKEFEKRLRDRLQLRHSLETQLLEQAEKEIKAKEEDAVFRDEMLKRLREEDKIEQMSNQRRRMKELEHKRAVQEMIVEREARRTSARQREAEELEMLRKADEHRLRIVEEERKKILMDHAIKLLGYLPKGTFKHKSELETLQQSLNQS